MKRKVIDIIPPKKFEDTVLADFVNTKQKSQTSLTSLRSFKKWLFVLFLMIVPALVLQFFFAQVDVRVWPRITELHIQDSIIAVVGSQGIDLEKQMIGARVFDDVKESTSIFASSGRKEKEQRAAGIIRVYNKNADESQTLVTNTRFISEEGKLFHITDRVVIPAGSKIEGKFVSGSLDVQVIAAEEGSEYNIKPSIFSLPGLAGSPLYTEVYGESFTNMKGGARSEVGVVTESDISEARAELIDDLVEQAKSSLVANIPSAYILLDESFSSEVLADKSLVKEGAELDQFNYTAKIRVYALGFRSDDAETLVRDMVNGYLQEGEEINEDTLKIAYKGKLLELDLSRMTIETTIVVDQYYTVDSAGLMRRLKGSSKSELGNILSGYPYVAKAEFSLWPFWVRTIPKDGQRLNIELTFEEN